MPPSDAPAPQLVPGVILDVDGTLLDSNYLHVVAWAQAMRDAGHPGVSMATLHRAIGIASAELVRHVLGRDDEAAAEAHGERFAALRDEARAFPAAADLVRRCAGAGLRVVLATSGRESDLDWMQPAIGAAEAVAGATTSADVGSAKPAPDLLQVALDQHRLDPERTVSVGDTVWDVEAAHRAALPCIALLCGGISRAELVGAGADEIYADPADLLAHFDDSLLARVARGPA